VRSRLARIAPPDEAAARDRAWQLVEAAYAAREPAPQERRRLWPIAAVAAAALAIAGAALSPPGMAVVDSIRKAIGVEHAQPALFSLPAPGQLLVVGKGGTWIVQADGSKRRLGSYAEATWSPFGHFVAATTENELRALAPDGDVRWSLARPGIRSPRWGGSLTDTRIAYISRDGLHVVAGDGTGDRLLAPAEEGPLAWRPGDTHELAYLPAGELRLQDTDTGKVVWRANAGPVGAATDVAWSADGRRVLVVAPTELVLFDAQGRERRRIQAQGPELSAAALSPTGQLAYLRHRGNTSEILLGNGKSLFSGTGTFGDLAWSPDGRWLLVTWPTANQWVFVRATGPRRIVAAAAIGRQFGGEFPQISGWCCAS
jgi:hypothetical protein